MCIRDTNQYAPAPGKTVISSSSRVPGRLLAPCAQCPCRLQGVSRIPLYWAAYCAGRATQPRLRIVVHRRPYLPAAKAGGFTGCLLYTSDAADDLTRVD